MAECGTIEKQWFPDGLIPHAQNLATRARVPLNVTMELTLGCNIRCEHCYNFDRDEAMPDRFQRNALSAEEIKRVIREVRDAGCLFLNFTGGEALLHPHILDFLALARDLNMMVLVLTNGTLLTAEKVSQFAAFPNFNGFSVSIYGATAETHDAVTQVKGSFAKTMRGVTASRDAGLRTNLKYIIMKRNAHETEAALKMAESLGLTCQVDMSITGRHDGVMNSIETRVDGATLKDLLRGPLRYLLPAQPRAADDAAFRCNCAQGNCGITAMGEVQPCISVPLSAGNLREKSFRDLWENSPLFQWLRSLTVKDFPVCDACDVRAYCRRNQGASFINSGRYTGVDPWICDMAGAIRDVVTRPSPAK